MAIEWHYSRRELADTFLKQFSSGITTALTLFAPRRMGKTEFLLKDLLPAAEAQGHRVVYCSFWEIREDPVKSMLLAIEDSRRDLPWTDRLRRFGRKSLAGLEVEVEIAGLKGAAKADFSKYSVDTSDLETLSRKIDELCSRHAKVLLLLDEVQHLATDEAFLPLVSLLRTVFERNADKLNVVYTGSSRDGLQRLFRQRNAPLFHSAQQIDLPALGAEFVQHMLKAFEQASGRALNLNQALVLFKQMHYVPYLFHTMMKQLLISGEDFKAGGRRILEALIDESEYEKLWEQFAALDRAILRWVVDKEGGVYTESAKRYFCSQTGVDEIQLHSIQNAVNRLRRKGYLSLIAHGQLVLEDEHFRDWVKAY